MRWVVRALVALVALRAVSTLPAHDAVVAVGMWGLFAWMLFRAFPAMREDVRRLATAVPPMRLLRRSKSHGGGF